MVDQREPTQFLHLSNATLYRFSRNRKDGGQQRQGNCMKMVINSGAHLGWADKALSPTYAVAGL